MKITITIAATLLVVILTSAPVSAATLNKADDAAVRKLVTDFETSWNTHDMKLLAALFWEDAEFVNVVGMHWRGRDDVVKAHAIFGEVMFKDCKIKTDAIDVRAISRDCAVAVVTETQDSCTTPNGHNMPKSQIRLNYIATKVGDDWKIAHAANTRIDAEAARHDPVNSNPK